MILRVSIPINPPKKLVFINYYITLALLFPAIKMSVQIKLFENFSSKGSVLTTENSIPLIHFPLK